MIVKDFILPVEFSFIVQNYQLIKHGLQWNHTVTVGNLL